MKKTKRIILVLMTILLMVIGTTIVSASTTYVYNKGDWKVRLDSPNTDGKTYWHLHFYQKGKHVYCLKLNNFKYCDGKNGKDKVPRKVMEKVMEHKKVQSAVKTYNPKVERSSVFKWILKVGAVTGSAILVFPFSHKKSSESWLYYHYLIYLQGLLMMQSLGRAF